jgi:hypothetical protein
MFITFSSDGVDDGVRGVQLDGSVGDLRSEICHVVMDEDMGLWWTLIHMVGVVCG